MRWVQLALLPALAATHSISRLSRAAIDACRGLDCWPEPEDAALACFHAIAALDDDDDDPTCPLPPQGEFAFGADVAFDDRFAVAEPLARAGDGAAMQTVGLLRYYGVGGAPKDDRASARWHAAAAASGRRLHLFAAFGALYDPEENAKYELPSDVDEWDPWSDHYPERLHRTGYVTLDELHPVSIIEKTRNL